MAAVIPELHVFLNILTSLQVELFHQLRWMILCRSSAGWRTVACPVLHLVLFQKCMEGN